MHDKQLRLTWSMCICFIHSRSDGWWGNGIVTNLPGLYYCCLTGCIRSWPSWSWFPCQLDSCGRQKSSSQPCMYALLQCPSPVLDRHFSRNNAVCKAMLQRSEDQRYCCRRTYLQANNIDIKQYRHENNVWKLNCSCGQWTSRSSIINSR